MLFHRLHKDATLPTKNPGDAGYDLYALEDTLILPGERKLVSTGISANLAELNGRYIWPNPCFTMVGIIKDRSGVSTKLGLHCMAGVIDRDYTGEIKVLMVNLNIGEIVAPVTTVLTSYLDAAATSNRCEVRIQKGQKIAQMVVTLAVDCLVQESEMPFTNELRGDKGFGSTGA